jgi:UDP-2,3-diacylglucosamine hydrolase
MPPKLGIIAGGGALPRLLVQHCQDAERPIFAVLLKGQADEGDFDSIPHATLRMGKAGSIIKRLHHEGVTELVLAGTITKPSWLALMPDFWTLSFLLQSGTFSKGDNTLLQALISALENVGFRVVGADDILPELLTPTGCLTNKTPNAEHQKDIDAGIKAALNLGSRDQGQAVVSALGRIIAEEDRRGTDAMLTDLNNGTGLRATGGVLVKLLKPNQERRVDLPSIGPVTIAKAQAAGLSGIVLTAGGSLIFERQAVIEAANRAGLFIVSADHGGSAS